MENSSIEKPADDFVLSLPDVISLDLVPRQNFATLSPLLNYLLRIHFLSASPVASHSS